MSQNGQVTATLVTHSAEAVALALSLSWHPWEQKGTPWGFPAWQSREELQQLSPPLPGLEVGARNLGRRGHLWGHGGGCARCGTEGTLQEAASPTRALGAHSLALLFLSFLLLIFIILLSLEFLASKFLDDNVLLTGRECRAQ